jgi:hypothetical protein
MNLVTVFHLLLHDVAANKISVLSLMIKDEPAGFGTVVTTLFELILFKCLGCALENQAKVVE